MSSKLCTKYKKQDHKKFPGFEMWKECLKGNQDAWKSMETYNRYDVLALEELYHKLQPWDTTINFNVYSDSLETVCQCGSNSFERRGFAYTQSGKFQRLTCRKCGAWIRSKENLFDKEKRKSLRIPKAS